MMKGGSKIFRETIMMLLLSSDHPVAHVPLIVLSASSTQCSTLNANFMRNARESFFSPPNYSMSIRQPHKLFCCFTSIDISPDSLRFFYWIDVKQLKNTEY